MGTDLDWEAFAWHDPSVKHDFLPMVDTPDYCARCWQTRVKGNHMEKEPEVEVDDVVWDVPITFTSDETAYLVGALSVALALAPKAAGEGFEPLRAKIINATAQALVQQSLEEVTAQAIGLKPKHDD